MNSHPLPPKTNKKLKQEKKIIKTTTLFALCYRYINIFAATTPCVQGSSEMRELALPSNPLAV